MKNNRLSGLSSLAYMGTKAQMPPNMFMFDRAPTQNDYLNFSLGDFWIHRKSATTNDSDLYVLMGVAQGVADWDLLSSNAGAITSLTGDTGGAILPVAGNINILGSHGINTAGTSGTITVAIDNSITLGDIVPIAAGVDALTLTSGNFTLSGTNDAGNIILPPTTATGNAGVIRRIVSGTPTRFIHSRGSANTFVGIESGNFTLTVATSSQNAAMGANTLKSLTTGANNAAMGESSCNALSTGTANTAMGHRSLFLLTQGTSNTAIGALSSQNLLTGANNTCVGVQSGEGLTAAESNNILINSRGTAGDSNTCRIGGGTGTGARQLNRCFISGIRGITTGVADAVPVLVDSANQLGVTSSSERYKQDIRSLGDASNIIYKLEPRFFHFKKHPEVPAWGLIAEEVDKVFPQLCVYDKEKRPEAVKYQDLSVLLLNELQKLNKRVEELEKKPKDCRCK